MLNDYQVKRFERLREFYRHQPCFTEFLTYTRVRKQKLDYMRAYINCDYTKAYTSRLRRAYAEAAVLDGIDPVINPDELIVGLPNHTPLTPEQQEEYDELEKCMKGVFDTTPLTIGHMALDYPKLLRMGVNGLLLECKTRLNALNLNLPQNLSKAEFYEGCIAELEALVRLQYRYRDKALLLAEKAEGKRKEELLQIADIMSRVPAEPARTFWEALESIHFYNVHLWELYYFGRVDQYLLPFYQKDVAEGRLTYDDAVELYACFMLMPEGYIMPNVALDAMIGGCDPCGNPVENDVTNIALDAIRYARSANGKVALCVTPHTSDAILRKAIQLNAEGLTQPALFNDEVVTRGLMQAGLAPEDARNYCNTGCVEVTPIGKSGIFVVAPYHNTLQMFMDALRMKPYAKNLDELFKRFEEIVRKAVFDENLAINRRQMERSRNGCEPMRAACLVSDCLVRGQAIDEGGAEYNLIEPNFLGMANTIDSFVAVEHLVFRDKEYTIEQLLEIVDKDFDGEEPLRQYILNRIPHYGMADSFADAIAVRLSELFVRVCDNIFTYRGSTLVPGAFSYLEHATYGRITQATPDGRRAGYTLASGTSPTQGRETNGPTAAMLSSTSWNHQDFVGGIAVNMKFTPGQMSGDNEDKMLDFIKTFMKRGGFQLQLNSVSRKTLLAAREHPDQYSDLLVRVGGFSAYFVKLCPEIQQEIIDRTEHEF